MNEIVKSFWIEGSLNLNNLLTIRSFQEHGYKFRIWSYDKNITSECEVVDANEIMDKSELFYYNHLHHNMRLGGAGDKFRARCMDAVGGWHVDMDVSCIQHLGYEDVEYVLRPHSSTGVVPNIIKTPANCALTKYYIEQTNKLDSENKDWEGSFSFLMNSVRENNLEKYIVNENIFGKDDWLFWQPLILQEFIAPNEERKAIHWVDSTGNEHNWTNYKKYSYFEKLLQKYKLI